jgi:hypothetical protein
MKSRKHIIYLAVLILASFALYLFWSWRTEGFGFPLDDAWIHQTYARNLGREYLWIFSDDTPSGGSTGPAWGFLIGILYFLRLPPIIGTYFIGFLLMFANSIISLEILRKLKVPLDNYLLSACVLLALEWHLIWSALSGMETLLLISCSLLLFKFLLENDERWWIAGLIIGLSIWARPDGLTLLGPAVVSFFARRKDTDRFQRKMGVFLGSFIGIFSLYCLFNWIVAGDIWPNTFYAKQAEYAILRESGFLARYFRLLSQFVTGIGILLIPGMILESAAYLKERNWVQLSGLAWFFGYIGLYAWRLPVTYQHGRYIIPAIPLGLVFGTAGILKWIEMGSELRWKRLLSAAWLGSALIVTISFWVLGAKSYSRDVAVIGSEMVKTALWINKNTDSDDVIAAHDIGALGYFSDREILDLAGLITPDVIPFIRDEVEIKRYLDQNEVDYLMTFPDWYPILVDGLEIAYKSGGFYAPQYGQENMTVFFWK